MKVCSNCGTEVKDNLRFCISCGKIIDSDISETNQPQAADNYSIENGSNVNNNSSIKQPEQAKGSVPLRQETDAVAGDSAQQEEKAVEESVKTEETVKDTLVNESAEQTAQQDFVSNEPETRAAQQQNNQQYQEINSEPENLAVREMYIPDKVKNDFERPNKKSRYAPISTWGYIGSILLMSVPIIGWIFAIVWACGGCRKINKRNLARTYIIFAVVISVSCLIIDFFDINIHNIIINLYQSWGLEQYVQQLPLWLQDVINSILGI